MAETQTIKFGEYQLNGPFSITRFERGVHGCGKHKSDMSYLKAWEANCTAIRELDVTSPTSVAFYDAAQSITSFIGGFIASETNLAQPEFWLAIRDAVISCNRLVCMPDFKFSDDISVKEAVIAVAFALDLYGRMSDVMERDKLVSELKRVSIDDAYTIKHALLIYLDIVCGRGAAWISYIDHMGMKASEVVNVGWWELRDAVAATRCQQLMEMWQGLFNVSEEAAGEMLMTQVSLISGLYGRYQGACYDRSHGENSRYQAKFMSLQDCRRDTYPTFVEDTLPDLTGYCRTFGLGACACAFDIPRQLEFEIRKAEIEVIMTQPSRSVEIPGIDGFGTDTD